MTSVQDQPRESSNGKEQQGTNTEAKPAAESHVERVSQQGQTKEQQDWISKEKCIGYIKENPDVNRQRSPSIVSIFRVPEFLKEIEVGVHDGVSLGSYVPKRVSLGPYHHGSAQLCRMDRHKKDALHRMRTRFNKSNRKDPGNMDFLCTAMEEIVKLEEKIRDSYEEDINWCGSRLAPKDSYEEDINWCGSRLAPMLSLDGCFILEILRTFGGEFSERPSECYEPIFEQAKIDHTGMDILNDIWKLENQIPLIVLRKLLELEFNSDDNVNRKLFEVLVEHASHKFYPFDQNDINKAIREWSWPQEEAHHLLSLWHSLIVSPTQDDTDQIDINIQCCSARCIMFHEDKDADESEYDNCIKCGRARCILFHKDESKAGLPRAVELGNAGIKFKPCTGGIKKIRFDENSRTIHLPWISISDHTEVLFRNLIAFEMCKPSRSTNYVACYVSLMDNLIDSEEDVALLRRMGIITDDLGSDGEVARFFNGLCKGVTVNLDGVFEQLTRKVNRHYKSELKVLFAIFMKEHFSPPWKVLAWVGALLGLALSIVQTIFIIKSA